MHNDQSLPRERNCILRFGAKIPGTTSVVLWYSQLLSNMMQNQRVRSDLYLRQSRLPLVTNGGLVAIGIDRYHILQRVGGHWSPLIQTATDVGSRWKSPNSDSKRDAESTRAFGLIPSAVETTIGHQWWPGCHWYRSVPYTSTGRWLLVTIDTNSHRCW